MAQACDYCQKGIQYGHNIRHKRGVAGGRWKRKAQKTKRLWLPNLHRVRVIEDGKIVRRNLCTKCMRRAERPKKKVEDKKEKKEIKKTIGKSTGKKVEKVTKATASKRSSTKKDSK